MNHKTFLILGGYGGVGRSLVRLLLQETDVRLVLAGRTVEKAEATVAQFNSIFDIALCVCPSLHAGCFCVMGKPTPYRRAKEA